MTAREPAEPRVCAHEGCGTVLSRYNRRKWCSVHEAAHPQRWVRTTGGGRSREAVSEAGR